MIFCHLHVHDEYSLLDGCGSSKQYLSKAKELGFHYLALTNHSNIDGLIKFQKEATKIGIKSILGCELYFVPDMDIKIPKEKKFHITVLIKNEIGFQNLCKILTEANLRGFYYKPRSDFKSILKWSEGLVFLTGCGSSALTNDKGVEFISDLSIQNKGDVYLEIMPHQLENQIKLNKLCCEFSQDPEFYLKLVATNDVHYILQKDNILQEVLLAIQTKAKWNDVNRFSFTEKTLFLRTEQEMKTAFAKQGILTRQEYCSAINNTIEIAEKCSGFSIQKKEIFLPKVNTQGMNEDDFFKKLCVDGYKKLFNNQDITQNKIYFDRFNEEFELIKAKKFVRYFLIVHELIEWCRNNDVMTGPGRGSSGGSLIAYLLRITTIDPIKYKLLFSRFITQDRIDYPDIDMDFADQKRHLVREYLEQLYGKNNIASVSTFLTMKGRMVVRDVARVFDVPLKEVDEFAKSIQDEDGDETSLETAVNRAEGRKFALNYPEVIDYSIRLEGQVRGASQHAAALIVSAEDLTQGTRGNLATRSNMEVINWDKEDAEYLGLMKLDVLGLNTLSVLSETKRLIKQNHNKDIIFEDIPLDNQKIFKMLSKGETVGVFQFNTWASTKLIKDVGVDSFSLMSDCIALVRPGPLGSGLTDEYIKRKHGQKWVKKHPLYEEITKDTFGTIIFQEQVMEVIYKVAGLLYSTADKIRSIIAKKRDVKLFEQYKQMFIDGCKKQETLSEIEAGEFWDMLEYHAGYSFNRSHAAAYSMISYWCAHCKLFYPTEFICANLTYGSQSKKEEMIKEAYRLGISLVLPKLGVSDPTKWVAKNNCLYVPFTEIKGVGEKVALQGNVLPPVTNTKTGAKLEGFFTTKSKQEEIDKKETTKGKLNKILLEIEQFEKTNDLDGLSKYFSFPVHIDKQIVQTVIVKPTNIIKLNTIKSTIIDLKSCLDCTLSQETEYGPVLPSIGKYNIAIVGEAPGKDENESGKGFVGRAGIVLWEELEKHKLYREDFYLSNICRCFPSITKTPKNEHIEKCLKWLTMEMEEIKPCLMLVFGNTGLKAFGSKHPAITQKNGEIEWNKDFNCWVCWCIHPSSTLHNPNNKGIFEFGINNFVKKVNELGGLS